MVLTDTTRGAEPDASAPMLGELMPQKGDIKSLHDVVQTTLAPMEGEFTPLEDTGAFAPMLDEFVPQKGDLESLQRRGTGHHPDGGRFR